VGKNNPLPFRQPVTFSKPEVWEKIIHFPFGNRVTFSLSNFYLFSVTNGLNALARVGVSTIFVYKFESCGKNDVASCHFGIFLIM
jgi:hypothetical protein